MLYLWKWWIVVCMVIIAWIWILKPEMLDKPIRDAQAVQSAVEEWSESKQKAEAYKVWMQNMRLPADCKTTESHVRTLECRNQRDLYIAKFERTWRNQR